MQETAWNSLIGHQWAVDVLRGALSNNRVGHAYLFTGPEHIGKTTLARLFAQALNCLEPANHRRPCGQCRSCKLIAVDRHPDVRLIEPEVSGRGKRTLKIETVRDLQHELSLAAYEARHKIAILAHFDSATTGAANAFLKTLEEPPGNVILLLTASEADTLLPTITSRCRVMSLRPLPTTEIAAALRERRNTPASEAEKMAHLADGRPGWALRALEEQVLLEERQAYIASLGDALAGGRVQRFELADRLAKDAETMPDLLRTWLSWWRDATLLVWGNVEAASVVNVDQLEPLRVWSRRWTREHVLRAVNGTKEAIWQLEHNANARLVLEHLLLQYPRIVGADLDEIA